MLYCNFQVAWDTSLLKCKLFKKTITALLKFSGCLGHFFIKNHLISGIKNKDRKKFLLAWRVFLDALSNAYMHF